MRKRLVRGVIAAFMAIGVLVPGTAAPARAIEPTTIIAIASAALNMLRSGGSDDALRAAVAQIIAAVENAKNQIIAHIDAIAAAEVSGCTRHHVIEFVDMNEFNTSLLQRWAQDATGCATLAEATLKAVTDKAAADNLGFALNVIMPIALAARARAHFSTDGLMASFRSGNEALIPKLAPDCRQTIVREPGAPVVENQYHCVAYNGDTADGIRFGSGPLPPSFKEEVAARATRNISRAVAVAVLPQLTA
jgi:hypothetical protein